jgi:hypothetical protein
MNDFENRSPNARIVCRRSARRPGKRSELLSTVADLLLIVAMAFAADCLTGQGHYVAFGAMGVAIYVSCQHYRMLRAEIRSLRAQVRRQGRLSQRISLPSSRPSYQGEYSRTMW